MAIVVSHLARDFDALARQALRQAPLADLIELRLDQAGDPGEERLREFVRAAKKPVIVAVHGPEAFGEFRGDLEQRLRILRTAARAGCAFVDVDWSLSLELGALEGTKCHRIVSRHETSGTPDDLAALEEEVREVLCEGDAVKLVTHARSAEDGLRVLRHLKRTRGGLIAFCSGERGAFTRILCSLFGSAFTYAAPARIPGEPEPPATAPGQIRVNDLLGRMPPGGVNASTAVFAVAGGDVLGSFSPHVHGMALKTAQLDAVFVALEAGDLEALLALLDDPCFRGLAVTAPFKEAAFRAGHGPDEAARAARAANTLVRDERGWRAFNTDAPAVQETLEKAWSVHASKQGEASPLLARGGPLAGARGLVLGAGGAARAALHALASSGARATVAARDPLKGRTLADEMRCAFAPWEDIPRTEHEILVHATPVGSALSSATEGRSPIPAEWIRPGTLVLDAIYRPIRTPLLEAALRKGCTAVPGAEWFVRQAALQFEHFTRHAPDDAVLRAAFEGALQASR